MDHLTTSSTHPHEKVGFGFDLKLLVEARDQSWIALNEIADSIHIGDTEELAKERAGKIIEKLGFEKNWHKINIRFGGNTTLSFSELSVPQTALNNNDIFYIDLGPVYKGFEGDVGKSFVMGGDDRLLKLKFDSEDIFKLVADHWRLEKCTGQALYDFANGLAEERGWKLAWREMDGHRLADFPHATYYRGSLRDCDFNPVSYAWVLEILLIDEQTKRGAFYEDLLF